MKKILLVIVFILIASPVFAAEASNSLNELNAIQARVDKIGTDLLNKNKITRRMVFAYDEAEKSGFRLMDKSLTHRQIIIYSGIYRFIQTDDELAAALSREIAIAIKSYSGMWGGKLDSVQVALSPKKFETVADKRAVDFMVNAGYNPLALIVFINKTCPQKKGDLFSNHNLTSKRLARIYEYITYKYPQYLENNEYTNNMYYQNFLLTSINNRKKLEYKIQHNMLGDLKYE